MFLFRDGLLTLMYRASLMALMRFCSSLPTMLKFSKENWSPVVVKWSKIGKGALRCSLNLSPNVLDHFTTTGHQVSLENFSIVGREEQNLMRAIKEALYIRVNNPSLNRNIGKYHLPHIWDEVLFNTSELKLK